MFLIAIMVRMPAPPANVSADLQALKTIAATCIFLAAWGTLLFFGWFFFGLLSAPFFYFSVRQSSIWQTAPLSDKTSALLTIISLGILAPITLKNTEEFLIESQKFNF